MYRLIVLAFLNMIGCVQPQISFENTAYLSVSPALAWMTSGFSFLMMSASLLQALISCKRRLALPFNDMILPSNGNSAFPGNKLTTTAVLPDLLI